MFSAALCDLPAGDDVASELSEADVSKLWMDCFYADPATDRPAILGAMAKTAAARQQWVRDKQKSWSSIPRMEDMPSRMPDSYYFF